MFSHDVHFGSCFSFRVFPAVLLETAHDPHTSSFREILVTDFGQSVPRGDIEVGHLLLQLLLLFEVAVAGYTERAHRRSIGRIVQSRISYEISLK
jgi:hypothetical protein